MSRGLTPATGSSRRTSLGSAISAWASESSFFCPPERLPASVSAWWARPTRSRISRALARLPRSWRKMSRGRSKQLRMPSPTWCWGASSMFSITVMRRGCMCDWKVRARPSRAMRSGAKPSIERPSKTMWPRSGSRKPVTTLNSVVLPEPLGPMRP